MTNTTLRRVEGALGLLILMLMPMMAIAQDLSLPTTAKRSFHTQQDPGAYALPVAPYADGALPTTRVEGRIEVESWRIPDAAETPFQLVQPLRDALTDAGFELLLDCNARTCGGFDFRFSTLVLPAPQMFVSLDNYHFISARKTGEGAVSLLASKGPKDGYVQIIRAGQDLRSDVVADAAPALPPTAFNTVDALKAQGHVVLEDLVFQSGSSELDGEAIGSLDALASYLRANPSDRLVFVGHTDATGSLDANRAVSLKRAQAAQRYMQERHNIRDQIDARGAGYLAPLASNLTDDGRRANRRVEAVLLPPQ